MSRFSQFLLKRQLLTEEQLEEALQHQAIYGARLGTNLVELRILTIETLAERLAEFHAIALPPRPWLERPKRNAIERVTRPLVERIRFIPLRLEANNILHAAVLDPNDPRTLDDLRFATGCKITPYVLPEIWMHDWLFTLFKLPRGIRHIEPDANQGPVGELDKPAQSFDFQAAQAAIAAKAARIMMPATVGVVNSPDSRPPSERKTLQGVDRAAILAEARAAQAHGDRSSLPGDPRAKLSVHERPTLPGSERATLPGAERATLHGNERVTLHGAERIAALTGRVTGQGQPAQERAGPAAPPAVAKPALPPASAPADTALDPFPTASAPPGASVRPPPIAVRSLADIGGRPSAPNAPVMPVRLAGPGLGAGPNVVAPAPGLSAVWDPQAPPMAANSVELDAAFARESDPGPVAGGRPLSLGEAAPDAARRPLQPLAAGSSPAPSAATHPGRAAPATPTQLVPAPGPAARIGQPAPAPPPPVLQLWELENALRGVADREQLIDLCFSIASRFAPVVGLFIVHRGMVQGVRCADHGEQRAINGVLVPLESASMLTQGANQMVPFRADPRERMLDARLQQLLSQSPTTEVSLFPVLVKQRVINLLYATQGLEPLGTISFGALSLLAELMGAAYGQLILSRKTSSD